MQAGLRGAYEGIKAFSETDFTEDLKKMDLPTLVLHGEDDQNVPLANSATPFFENFEESDLENLSGRSARADRYP